MKLEHLVEAGVASNEEQLKLECSNFVNSSKAPLFRGAHFPTNDRIIKASIRQDREPSGLNGFETSVLNTLYNIKFGIPNIRNRAMFTSLDSFHAEGFGTLYYVFPINGSRLFYMEGIDDTIGLSSDTGIDLFYRTVYSTIENFLVKQLNKQLPAPEVMLMQRAVNDRFYNSHMMTDAHQFAVSFTRDTNEVIQELSQKYPQYANIRAPLAISKEYLNNISHHLKMKEASVDTINQLGAVVGEDVTPEILVVASHAYLVRVGDPPLTDTYSDILRKIKNGTLL